MLNKKTVVYQHYNCFAELTEQNKKYDYYFEFKIDIDKF